MKSSDFTIMSLTADDQRAAVRVVEAIASARRRGATAVEVEINDIDRLLKAARLPVEPSK